MVKEVDTKIVLNHAVDTLKKMKCSLPPDKISVKHELRLEENTEAQDKRNAYFKKLEVNRKKDQELMQKIKEQYNF